MVDPLSLLEVVRQQHLILTLWRSISCNLGPLLHPLLLQERSGKSQPLCRLPYRTPLVRLKTRLKRSFVGGGHSGNQQQKKGDLREGVSEKTKDGAALGEEKEHAPIVKGRGKPGPRVLSPIPGPEPHASCGASSRAAATTQDLLALMTATPAPEDHEEK